MASSIDISTQSLDEVEQAIDAYDPYSPVEPDSFTPSLLEPNPDTLTDAQIRKATANYPNPDVMSDEEMFNHQAGYTYEFLGIDLPVKAVEKVKSVVEKSNDLAVKGIWKGLGVLAWPFERIEYGIGTPTAQMLKTIGPVARSGAKFEQELILKTPAAKNAYKNKVRSMITPYTKAVLGDRLEPMLDDQVNRLANGWMTQSEFESNLTTTKQEAAKLIPSFVAGAKSFIPFTRNDPQKVKDFNDVWSAYYEEMTGEQAPGWFSQTGGAATGFVVTPFVFGKMLQAGRVGLQRLPFIQSILAKKLPTWEDAKLMRRASIYERNERAVKLGKSLANKDARRIAHQLSIKSGKTISKKAVKLRLGQIIKGSVTQQAALSEAANPVIEELQANFKELQKLGILGEETFLTKLSKGRITELNSEKAKLTKQLTRLQTAPHYVGTPEISARFPGRAKRISELQSRIDSIDETLWNATHFGGSGQLYMPRMYLTKLPASQAAQAAKATLAEPKTLHEKVYMKFFKNYIGAIRNNADNIVAGAGNKKKQIKNMQELFSKIQTHYDTIAEHIKQNPELLKDLRSIQEKLPQYSEAIGQFAKKPTPEGFRQIRSLSDQITQLAEKYGQNITTARAEELTVGLKAGQPTAVAGKQFPVTSNMPKIKAEYAKKRKNIPFEVRQQMGEILEPAYPVTRRLIQEAQDIETGKLFEFASKQGAWVDDVWHEGLFEKALPDTKTYGALAGKYVHPKIYADVTELNRVRSNFESIYDSLIGTWKTAKVTLNPSTHFRNTISNSILLDLSGTDHIQQGRLFVKALKEIRAGSDEYQTAKKFFGHTTMMTGEIMDDLLRTVVSDNATGLQKTVNAWNSVYNKASALPRKVYQEEEFIFKFMKFLEQREQGKSVIGSVREANKWLFDYGDLSRFEKVVARRVMPFYTFPRKALPRILEAAEKNPLALAKYPVLAWTEEKFALHQLDLTEKDYQDIEKVLPEYMKNGSYMLMPFRDANGDLRFFDWTYILPWGELYDAQDRGLLGEVVTNPMIQVTADIMRNKSGWSGREIWQESDTPKERTFKQMLHLWQTAVPSLMYQGIYWDRLYNAATKKPSKMGDVPPLAPTIAHTVFGLRTQPINIEDQRLFRMYDKMRLAEELEKKIADISIREAHGNITQEEYDQKRQQYIQQIQKLFSEEGPEE